MLEIELKASLEGMFSEEVLHRAQSCGFVPCEQVRETDIYFNGDQRDFRRTDEALRLRSLTVLPDGPCVPGEGFPVGLPMARRRTSDSAGGGFFFGEKLFLWGVFGQRGFFGLFIRWFCFG